MRKKFQTSLTVIEKESTFAEIYLGDCFVLNGTIGFENIWLGFDLFIKISDTEAYNVNTGFKRQFEGSDIVLKTILNNIEKPLLS